MRLAISMVWRLMKLSALLAICSDSFGGTSHATFALTKAGAGCLMQSISTGGVCFIAERTMPSNLERVLLVVARRPGT
jgi:hypothetical protein